MCIAAEAAHPGGTDDVGDTIHAPGHDIRRGPKKIMRHRSGGSRAVVGVEDRTGWIRQRGKAGHYTGRRWGFMRRKWEGRCKATWKGFNVVGDPRGCSKLEAEATGIGRLGKWGDMVRTNASIGTIS